MDAVTDVLGVNLKIVTDLLKPAALDEISRRVLPDVVKFLEFMLREVIPLCAVIHVH